MRLQIETVPIYDRRSVYLSAGCWVTVHVMKASGHRLTHTHKDTHAGGAGTLHCLWAVALWGRQFGWWPCLSLLLPLCPSGGPCWDLGLGQRTDCNFNLFSCGIETWGPELQWKITSARAKIATTEYDTALKYTGKPGLKQIEAILPPTVREKDIYRSKQQR